jgi:hypothetical protein
MSVNHDLLGQEALAWVALGAGLPPGTLRLVLADVDGVITRRGDNRLSSTSWNTSRRSTRRPGVTRISPAITLCTGRQAPYVELVAQLTDVFLPCIFEHGAGLFFPTTFRYEFDARLGSTTRHDWHVCGRPLTSHC